MLDSVLDLYTDASGNWSTLGHWQVYVPTCKLPVTISLNSSGNTPGNMPNGTPIAGSGTAPHRPRDAVSAG